MRFTLIFIVAYLAIRDIVIKGLGEFTWLLFMGEAHKVFIGVDYLIGDLVWMGDLVVINGDGGPKLKGFFIMTATLPDTIKYILLLDS